MKRLWGEKDVDKDIVTVLLKLDRLTQYEHLNAAAQTLGVISGEQTHFAVTCFPLNTFPSRCPGKPRYALRFLGDNKIIPQLIEY